MMAQNFRIYGCTGVLPGSKLDSGDHKGQFQALVGLQEAVDASCGLILCPRAGGGGCSKKKINLPKSYLEFLDENFRVVWKSRELSIYVESGRKEVFYHQMVITKKMWQIIIFLDSM